MLVQTNNSSENWTAFKSSLKTFSKNIKKSEHEHLSTHLAKTLQTTLNTFFFKSRRQDITPITVLTNTSNIPVTHLEHKTRLLNTHFYFHTRKR